MGLFIGGKGATISLKSKFITIGSKQCPAGPALQLAPARFTTGRSSDKTALSSAFYFPPAIWSYVEYVMDSLTDNIRYIPL